MKIAMPARLGLWVLLSWIALSPLAGAQAVDNPQAIVRQARQSYYDLRREGLSSFQCAVTPDWELLLQQQRKQDPASADAAIKVLSQLRFSASLAADGSVKLTHNQLTGQSQQMMDALSQIYGGMEQMTTGFFDTWKLFVLSPPFPEVESQYQLQSLGEKYQLSYKDGTADVVTTMDKSLAISNLSVTTSDFDSVVRPGFTSTPKGLLFNAYSATYNSKKPEEATELKVAIGYQEIQGLEIIQELNLSGSYGGSSFAVRLTFSDCQVTKK